jgi:hypothetical protein
MRRNRNARLYLGHGRVYLGSGIAQTGINAGISYGASQAATAATTAGFSLLGTAIPVVGTIFGALLGGILAAHAARVAGAKNENAALNSLVPQIQADIQQIAAAYNSGQITPDQAIQALQTVQQSFWSTMAPFEKNPGQAGGPGTCTSTGTQKGAAGTPMTSTVKCDKSHTASTCVGCIWINNYVDQFTQLIQKGAVGTFQLQGPIEGNGYGFVGAPAMSITLRTPPPASAISAAAGGITGLLAGSGTGLSMPIFGIPVWILLAVGGLYLVMR